MLAGGADGGGAGGKGGKNGKGKKGAGTDDGDEDASGEGEDGGEGCGDPVCPITGRMFLDIYDFGFGGPLPLKWVRSYSSRSRRVGDLGVGWSHPFEWEVIVKRRRVIVIDDAGKEQKFGELPQSEEPIKNGLGWRLRRHGAGLRLTRPNGTVLEFGPDVGKGVRRLVASGDLRGNRHLIERDAQGRLVRLLDSAGRAYRVQTDPAGRIVSIAVATDPNAVGWLEVASYTYDSDGDLTSFTDAEGFTSYYRYFNHLMVEHRTASGLSYLYRYDGRTHEAYCIESWGEYVGAVDPALEHPIPPAQEHGPDDRKPKGINYVAFTYLKEEHYSEVENGLGGIARYFGDASGRVVKKVDAAGGVTESFFDAVSGATSQESQPNENVRRIARSEQRDVLGFEDSSGQKVDVYVDADGVEVRVDRDNNSIIRRTFDPYGSPTFIEHADGSKEQFDYDPRGLMLLQVDRLGAARHFHHDAMGNCVAIDTPLGRQTSEYDYLGRRTAHVDELGRRTEWGWDRKSNVVFKRHHDGSEIRVQYDANRKPTQIDESGRIVRLEWGGMAWLVRVIGHLGDTFEFRYDVEGDLTYVENPRGQVHRQTFDHARRCIGVSTFEGQIMTAAYDAAGRAIWIETADGREIRAYNLRDELTMAECPDGQVISLARSPDGVLTIDNGAVAVEEQYDGAGQILRDRQGRFESNIKWTAGKVAAIVTNTGLPVTLTTTAFGRTERAVVGTTSVRFNEQTPEGFLTRLGERLLLRRYTSDARLLTHQALARFDRAVAAEDVATMRDPNLVVTRLYEHDAQLSLVRETRSDGRIIQYTTNVYGQVTRKAVYANGTLIDEENIAYDRSGTPLLAGVRFDSQMRPIARGNEEMTYDARGRLATRLTDAGEWRYEWSSASTLVRVVAPDHVVEMAYDAKGRRMQKRVLRGGELVRSTSYVWTNHVVLHEVDDATGTTRTYLREDGAWEPIGHVDLVEGVEKPCFYLCDPSGAIEMAVDGDGNVVWDAERTVYGDYRPTVSKVDVTVRMANQFYDADVELVYNMARWYDPKVGLFVSPDPLLLKGNINPRDYAKNPLVFIDPMGLVHVHPGVAPGTPRPAPANGHARRPSRPTDSSFDNDGTYLLSPGHWATEGGVVDGAFIPGYAVATGSERTESGSFPPHVRDAVDLAGQNFGCHSCGTRDPGTEHGHFIPDHQPPASSVRHAEARGDSVGEVRLYPHCLNCSRSQFRQAGRGTRDERADRAVPQADINDSHRPRRT